VAKTPWWVRVKGGRNAIQGMANFGVSESLRNAWYVQNQTRLRDNPELSAAVSSANVPYATARRMDLAFQASKAEKQQNIEAAAGRSPAMQNPAQSMPAQAQVRANAEKPKERHGFFEHVWGGVQDFASWLGADKPVIGDTVLDSPGGKFATTIVENESKHDIPLWQQPFELAKDTVKGLGTALTFAQAPVTAPLAAGSADKDSQGQPKNLSFWERAAMPSTAGQDLITGVGRIAGGVDSAQAEDMRRGGYNPDSWWDRYSWYGNFSGDNNVVSDKSVRAIKEEGHDPRKVDLAREVLTVGVLEHPERYNGLSPDAQRFFTETQATNDKDGQEIFKKLADRSAVTLGGHIADQLGMELGSTDRQVVSALGDMAAYWYLDPTIVAGKAFTAFRDARYAVDFEPQAIKEAIVNTDGGNNRIAARWDDALDRIDRIHVLQNTNTAEAQAQAAKELSGFQQSHRDMMPFYDTLLGMREGSVTGTVFKEPGKNARFRDPGEFNPIDIHRETDPAKYKPVFQMRNDIGDKVTQDMRDAARAEIADRIADAVYANAMTKGQPLTKPQFLMPGQFRVASVYQKPLQWMTDKVLGQDGKLLDQLKEAEGKGLIDFNSPNWRGDVAAVVDSAAGGKWIRENYTRGGLRDKAAMTLSRFATVRDAPVLSIDGIDSVKTFHDFVRFFMPRGQAAFMANRWAKADPAARSAMLSSTVETIANARHLKDGKVGIDYWRQQLKGREAPILPGEHAKEAYSSPDVDLIDTPSGPVAAGMYSTQFASGVQLPSFVDILRNTEKVGILSMIAGWSHSRAATTFTQLGKVGQVGTTSNMLRQVTEGRALQFADDPLGATHAALARLGLAGKNAALRAELNDAVRQARKLAGSGEMDKLTPLHGRKMFEEYADEAANILQSRGITISPHLDAWLRAGAAVPQVTKGRSAARLATTRVLADPLRRGRAALYSRFTEKTEPFSYEWLDRVDDGFADRLLDGTNQYLGGSAAHWMDGAIADDANQVRSGTEAGQRLAQVKLRNTHDYLGAAGDSGALRWNNALGIRLTDPVGGQVLPAVARVAVHEARVEAAAVKAVDRARDKALKQGKPFGPVEAMMADHKARTAMGTAADDPVDLARKLLTDDPAGQAYRVYGRRGQYLNGEYVGGTPDATAALRGWADQMVQDARRYLGLEAHGITQGSTDAAHLALLKKIGNGTEVSADDLAKVAEDFRPEQVHAPVIVGRKFVEPNGWKSIPDKASKMYNFVVAAPLKRLVHDPQIVAAHREAMITMEPLARALSARGMTNDNIYKTLDTMAYGHAIKRVTRYSDDPHVTSYFAALSNNFLWYERAMEDFARRAIRITKADPAKVARSALAAEAAHHSGMVYEQKSVDDDGSVGTDWMFTWPGSGWLTRTVNEGARNLGLVDDDVVKVPVWQDWASPVKYLSPSLQNPFGFSATPLVGLPLRVVKSIWPETTPLVENYLTAFEGGERHFASDNILESLLPVYMRRVWNTVDQGERDSQVASATRNALMYLQAAGQLPGPGAPEQDRARALDDVRTMVQNLVIWRSAFAMFAPATPGTMASNISGIGDEQMSEIDRLRGITSIRGEWFQMLEDMNKRYPDDSSRAFSEAAIEWMKRDMGSILQPAAFTTGSSGAPGMETGKSGPSNEEVTQWMLDNREFLKNYGQVGYALIPSMGEAYYNKTGFDTQLRTGLRQHKDLKEFYNDLVIAQANNQFFSKLDERTAALDNAHTDDERNAVKNRFNKWLDQHKRANPVWAGQLNATQDKDYISANIAPAVRRLAEDPNPPANVKPMQSQLKALADLYDKYREAQAKYPGTKYADVNARKSISFQYNARAKALFQGSPIDAVWKQMRTFED
jgi:hypothetical protein